MDIKMKSVAAFAALLLAVSLPLMSAAESRDSGQWLGAYVGSMIPGYTVMGSSPYTVFYSGVASVDVLRSLQDDLVEGCRKKDGIGLINSTLFYSLGSVQKKESGHSTSVLSPGLMAHATADCVTKVQSK